ncbi:MAG: N-acetylmuramoyl-L-alanine amidase [Clostridia bacterium]|nr:N-acetylmuramoyl-L-alanine amidase [Clostridia bacterium]
MKIFSNLIKRIRKNHKGFFAVFFGVLMLSAFAYVAYGKINERMNECEKNNSSGVKTIVLDAGHGGEDGGAVGAEGIIEKDINLSVALKLRDILKASGYKVIMTREKDIAIYDDSAKTLREKKRSDLHNRLDIIEENSGENVIFVSIHQNKFPDSKYHGTQIFYSKHDPKSIDLAQAVRKSVTEFLQPDNDREIKEANQKIYLLNNSKIPAIVVECGFLSNPEECAKLADKNYQSEMAFSVYCGLMDYFSNHV